MFDSENRPDFNEVLDVYTSQMSGITARLGDGGGRSADASDDISTSSSSSAGGTNTKDDAQVAPPSSPTR